MACVLINPIRYPLLDEDEPRYVATASTMLDTGDFIVPEFNGKPRYQKPALTYWVMAASMAIVGEDSHGGLERAARLPSGLAAVAIALLLYGTVAPAVSRRAAWVAAVGFLATPMAAVWSRAASTDMLLTLLLSAAVLCAWYAGRSDGMRRSALYVAASGLTGLAFLAKGPVGLLLPVLITAVTLGLHRRLGQELKRFPWVGGIAAFSVLGLGWYVAIYLIDGPAFLQSFFMRENLGRLVQGAGGPKEALSWARLMVPGMAIVGLAPISPFAIGELARRPDDDRHSELLRLAKVWFWVTLVVFALPRGQWPSYALPLAPPLCVLAAIYMERFMSERRRVLPVGALIGVTIVALVYGIGFCLVTDLAQAAPDEYRVGLPARTIGTLLAVTSATLVVGMVLGVVAWRHAGSGIGIGVTLGTWLLGFGVFAALTAPVLIGHLSGPQKAIGECISGQPQDEPVLTYGPRYSTLVHYADRPLELFTQTDPAFEPRLTELLPHGPVLVVTDAEGKDELGKYGTLGLALDEGRLCLFEIHSRKRKGAAQ